MMGADRLLTPEEAAETLRVSTRTLRQLRQQGLIRYVAISERKILYRPEDCQAFAESRLKTDEPITPPRMQPRRRPARRNDANVVSFTARRRERLGLGAEAGTR